MIFLETKPSLKRLFLSPHDFIDVYTRSQEGLNNIHTLP